MTSKVRYSLDFCFFAAMAKKAAGRHDKRRM